MLRNAFPPPSKIYCNGTLSDEITQQKSFSAHYRDCSSARKASKAKRDAAPAASPFLPANRRPAICRRRSAPPSAAASALPRSVAVYNTCRLIYRRPLSLPFPRKPPPRVAAPFTVDTAAYLWYFLDRWKIYNTVFTRCKSVSDNGRGSLSRFFVRRGGNAPRGKSYIPVPCTK